jgi:hypothetical protein
MSTLDFFAKDPLEIDALARYLDSLTHAQRMNELCKLGAPDQARLFEAVQGFRPLALEHFVPQATPPLHEIIHGGSNSLPMFRRFEKRFCRPPEGKSSERLWGYNHQSTSFATGPGYFVCYAKGAGEVLIDYLQVPEGPPPAGWPKILPNSAGLSRFIYHQTQDTIRGVSAHVSVGRASRGGKPMDNWFVLSRMEGLHQ